jgi:hypothetical protein
MHAYMGDPAKDGCRYMNVEWLPVEVQTHTALTQHFSQEEVAHW